MSTRRDLVAASLAVLGSAAYAFWSYVRRRREKVIAMPVVPFEIHPRIYENSMIAERANLGPRPPLRAAAAAAIPLPLSRNAPHETPGFGIDLERNMDDVGLDDYMTMPLEGTGITHQNRIQYLDTDAEAEPEPKLEQFRFIRLKVLETRDSGAGRVSLGGFKVMWGTQAIDLPGTTAWNPHTGIRRPWVPTEGWSDGDQYELILCFPHAVAVTRYQFRTASEPAGQDPRRWRLEGSQNGTFWLTIDDRSGGGFIPEERGVWMNYRCGSVAA